MSEDFSREIIEEKVDEITKPMKEQGFLEALASVSMPEFLVPLKNAREVVANLEDSKRCECGEPTCVGKGVHVQYIEQSLDNCLPAARTFCDMVREETIEFCYKLVNCKCGPCKSADMSNAAPFN